MKKKDVIQNAGGEATLPFPKGGELVAGDEESDVLIGSFDPTLGGVKSPEGKVVMLHLYDLINRYVVLDGSDPGRAELSEQMLRLGPLLHLQCPEIPEASFRFSVEVG